MLAPLTLLICYKYKMWCLITMSRTPFHEIGIQEGQARDVANQATCAGIFRQSMGARNRVGIGLSYRPPGYIGWRN
jgi:hypothetical protein